MKHMSADSWMTGVLALALVGCLSGCSVSYSTGKSSDAVSAVLDSVSASSPSPGASAAFFEEKTYIRDIAAATVLYVKEQHDDALFAHTLAIIATDHGVVDWAGQDLTYTGMGRGLRQAGVAEQQIESLSFFRTLVPTARFARLLAGYKQV